MGCWIESDVFIHDFGILGKLNYQKQCLRRCNI